MACKLTLVGLAARSLTATALDNDDATISFTYTKSDSSPSKTVHDAANGNGNDNDAQNDARNDAQNDAQAKRASLNADAPKPRLQIDVLLNGERLRGP